MARKRVISSKAVTKTSSSKNLKSRINAKTKKITSIPKRAKVSAQKRGNAIKPRKKSSTKQKLNVKNEQQDIFTHQNAVPDSYIHAIMAGLKYDTEQQEKNVCLESMIFSKLLVHSIIPASEQYKSGFRIGRIYYNQIASIAPGRAFRWYEDSLPALSDLFKHFGYAFQYRIARNGDFTIILKDSKQIKLGFNMHQFEAGIISGFLSSAKNSYVPIGEKECSLNGNDECVFDQRRENQRNINIDLALKNFAAHLHAVHMHGRFPGEFSSLYNALILSSAKHVRSNGNSMHRLGEYVANKFDINAQNAAKHAKLIFWIMNSVAASKAIRYPDSGIEIAFDLLNSDSNYINSLEQFAKGLSSESANVSIRLSDAGLYYVLSMDLGAKLLKLKNK